MILLSLAEILFFELISTFIFACSEFKSDQIHAAFVFYGLDGPIEDTLIAFSKIDENLKNQVRNTPFDFYTAGKLILNLSAKYNQFNLVYSSVR